MFRQTFRWDIVHRRGRQIVSDPTHPFIYPVFKADLTLEVCRPLRQNRPKIGLNSDIVVDASALECRSDCGQVTTLLERLLAPILHPQTSWASPRP